MNHRSKGDAGEFEFTRAAADAIRDIELACQVAVVTRLEGTGQRGVFAVVLHAISNDATEGVTYVAAYEATWPNSYAVSFAAFYYQCTFKLARMVEAWYQSRLEAKQHG